MSRKYKTKALRKLRSIWGQYIDKAKHGNDDAYVIYLKPGSDSQQISGWIDNNLIVIKTVDDIINTFNAGLISIKAATMQGNEYMTFKLEVATNQYRNNED